jgi:hypothetical protein
VVPHTAKAAPVAAAKPAAKPLTARQQLANAVRASLAAHTVQFRYRDTKTLVDPVRGENVNPFYNSAGIANFDSNRVTAYTVAGEHANQPYVPSIARVVEQDSQFMADSQGMLFPDGWAKGSAGAGSSADVQVTQVMQAIKGPVKVVSHTANITVFQMQSNLGQMLRDQGGAAADPLANLFAGTTQTENVWVNRDGRVVRARWTIDPSKVHAAGVSSSVVKAVYITIDFTNYGVDMVVPPHETV